MLVNHESVYTEKGKEYFELSGRGVLLYKIALTLGYCAVFLELPFAKFAFDTDKSAINNLYSSFSDKKLNVYLVAAMSAYLVVANAIQNLTSVTPEKDIKNTFNIKKFNQRYYTLKNDDSEDIFSFKNPKKLIFARAIPFVAMAFCYFFGTTTDWLGVNSYLHRYPWINIPLGCITIALGIFYFILLSTKDLLNSLDSFLMQDNPSLLLYRHSKLTFFDALSRVFVATAYRSTLFGYITDEFFNKILKQEGTLKTIFLIAVIASTAIVTMGTRLPPACKHFLAPFERNDNDKEKTKDNRYNFNLITAEDRQDKIRSLKPLDLSTMLLKTLPLGLIRALGYGYFFARLMMFLVEDRTSTHVADIIFCIAAVCLGSLIFYSSFHPEVELELNHAVRTEINKSDPEAELMVEQKVSPGIKIFTSCLNFSSQLALALLSIESMIFLLSSRMGLDNSISLGVVVGAEASWTGFHYQQEKMEPRVDQIIRGGHRLVSKGLQCLGFFSPAHADRELQTLESQSNTSQLGLNS